MSTPTGWAPNPPDIAVIAAALDGPSVLYRHHRRAQLRLALFLAARPSPTKPTTGRAMICDNTGNTCTADRHELECVTATCTFHHSCTNVEHDRDCPAGWDQQTAVFADRLPEVGEV